uniref:Cysteine-rich receptor-like protein kinase 25 n=1 Tax=Oryza nivara TaxID=4536 RepID=A0A0E0I1Q4_ORYNI
MAASHVAAVALLLLVLPRAAESYPWGLCNDTAGNFPARRSGYLANINLIAATLPGNASASPDLFATVEGVGAPPDQVSALALCRGDANASTCLACLTQAFLDLPSSCAYDKVAAIFYDSCLLAYSNATIAAGDFSSEKIPIYGFYNNANATTEQARFNRLVAALVNATADYAARNSTRRRYASGQADFNAEFPKVYSWAQCTPDLTPASCRSCLAKIIGTDIGHFENSVGGFVRAVRCSFQYSTTPFLDGPMLVRLQGTSGASPAPSPAAVVPAVNQTPATPTPEGETVRNRQRKAVSIAVPTVAAVLTTSAACFYAWRRTRRRTAKPLQSYPASPDDIQSIDSLHFDLSALHVATDGFAEHNRLGEGGFGVVYKGILPEGQQIAVKRLSEASRQGIEELKTELLLVAKLNHKNLVRLVGVCLESHEKILVYEYMPNRSLDTILFDTVKNKELDWSKRFKIIDGIARGLQYLHEDSQMKIVHRDLKASNILLDSTYNPKISDFGLAKIFGGDQSHIVTYCIVGTYGYMSPEYAMHGKYSIKSDVFSFGVLVLEIVTGRKNLDSCDSEQDDCPIDLLLKCIHIGLLCVQQKPSDRPLMSAVNFMLSSKTARLPSLSRPTFCRQETCANSTKVSSNRLSSRQSNPEGSPYEARPMYKQVGNYEASSKYLDNVNLIGATLPGNASASPDLFATAEHVGSVPDQVSALALCRGDANPSSCLSCLNQAFRDLPNLCAYNKVAAIFYDSCQLSYSNATIAAGDFSSEKIPIYGFRSYANVTTEQARYNRLVAALVNATADYAARNSTRRRYASGEADFNAEFPKVYSWAQCTPDLSPASCRSCLAQIIGRGLGYFENSVGGFIRAVRCSFQYSTTPFLDGPMLVRLQGTSEAMRNGQKKAVSIAVPTVVAVLTTSAACFYAWRRTRRRVTKPLQSHLASPDDIQSIDSLHMDLSALRVATDGFAMHNRLGEGGFGVVYKGILLEGQEIAVKRLSEASKQGIEELKTELLLVAKLNHKNLVRLVGVCLESDEKILVYEYMPNRSLDTILFDTVKNKELDWSKRFKIIDGIARGLQYLHEDSQMKIVHRDLKASNVLLDSAYNPKISDFGLAKIFGGDQSHIVTYCIAGTYGYMSPEYAMHGKYSIKSDVFSFGVLVLEIVTGRRNLDSCDSEQDVDLINDAWEHWTREKATELVDPSLSNDCPIDLLLKCIHIGLLCVQQKPSDRPLMSAVNFMLSSKTVQLPSLSRSTFCRQQTCANSTKVSSNRLSSQHSNPELIDEHIFI